MECSHFVYKFWRLWGFTWPYIVICAQLCPTLCAHMVYSLPGSSVHGLPQARIVEWGAISYSKESSQPKDQIWGLNPSLLHCRQILCRLSHQGSPSSSLSNTDMWLLLKEPTIWSHKNTCCVAAFLRNLVIIPTPKQFPLWKHLFQRGEGSWGLERLQLAPASYLPFKNVKDIIGFHS